jgi:uncharacterized RDD family membrane protein YckC
MVVLDQPQKSAPNLVYASFFARFFAKFVDAVVIMIPSIFMPIVAPWLYFALMESSEKGASVGKKLMGLRVLSEEGKRIDFGTATGRFFAHFINGLTMGIGYLLMLFNSRSQCLHDIITGTVVVRAESVRPDSSSHQGIKRSWSAKANGESFFVEIHPEGGKYWHRSATSQHSKTFTLWQLADGMIDFKQEFGPQAAEEMRQYAEGLLTMKG